MNKPYQIDRWSKPAKRCFLQLALVFLFTTVSACDGGIFGTGDGNDGGATIVTPDMSPDSNVATPVESPPDSGGSTTDGASTDGSTTDGAATDGSTTAGQETPPDGTENSLSAAFANSVGTTGRNDALVRFINTSPALQDSIVVTVNNERDSPLLPLPGLDYVQGASGYLSVSATGSSSMELLLAENFRAGESSASRLIKPLDLVAGSVTTVIVRDTPAARPSDFNVLPLVTLSTTGNTNASVRVVHAAGSLETDSVIDVVIVPLGGTRDQALPGFAPLEFSNQPETEYVETAPGQYTVQFDVAGETIGLTSNINPIELTSGQTTTLVIRDTQTGEPGREVEVLLLRDSKLP